MSKLQIKAVKKHGRGLTKAMALGTRVICHKHKDETRKTTNEWLKEVQHER